MFKPVNTLYLAMPVFSADPNKLADEIHDTIAQLNLKAVDFSSNKSFYAEYLGLINQAETFATKTHGPDAHKAIWEATACVNRALESQGADKFRKWIGWYLTLWLLALGAAGWFLKDAEGCASTGIFGFGYWRYAMMGALGGIVIAVWGLIIHTANLDFDRHFSVWYWFKPILGAVMGLVAVVTALGGLLAIQGQGSLPSSTSGKMVLYILAFLAGFSERFFIDIIDRVMTALLSNGKSSSSLSKSAATRKSATGSTP